MPKVTIEFKRTGGAVTALILHYRCVDGKLKYYTGESSEPGKLTKKAEEMIILIEATAADHRLASIPLTTEILKEKLDLKFRPAKASGLINKMERVVDKMKTGEIRTPDEKRYSPGSIKSFSHTVRFLSGFRPNINVVTIKTYNEFITWCHEKNYSTNYIGNQIKNWKTLGKAVGGNAVYDTEEFKKITEETFDIYLTGKEISKIYNHRLSVRESKVRDWFIIDYYTGLRISDIQLLTDKNINKNLITIVNEKTDFKVVIPVHKCIKEILKKYNGLPPKTSDQEINRVIKKVAEKVGIKETVIYSITKGGRREDYYFEKWQMVSNHTARRSFITNLLLQGVSESLVMKLTGIKSAQTLQRYNKMTSEDAARVMGKHKFFK